MRRGKPLKQSSEPWSWVDNPDLIKKKLEEKGLSQGHLAERLGINQPAVSRLLRGQRKMLASEALEIGKFLFTPFRGEEGHLIDQTAIDYPAILARLLELDGLPAARIRRIVAAFETAIDILESASNEREGLAAQAAWLSTGRTKDE